MTEGRHATAAPEGITTDVHGAIGKQGGAERRGAEVLAEVHCQDPTPAHTGIRSNSRNFTA